MSPCPAPSATTAAAAAQQAQAAAPSSLGGAASVALPGGLSLPLDMGSAARGMDPAALQAEVEKVGHTNNINARIISRVCGCVWMCARGGEGDLCWCVC